MHDPLTVIHTFHWPRTHTRVWKNKEASGQYTYKNPFITLWHKDPERDGSDDSCGWFSPHLTRKELEWCKELIEYPHDNLQSFFGDAQDTHEMRWRLAVIIRNYKKSKRPWWRHPRWHIWHWRIQVHPWQNFKRKLFGKPEPSRASADADID